ncbi:N-methyl-L-tryptophan oxidase [candidate division KSB1 bacterium]|nr:MAG: N-methyl-L-tryptophan oxidase [candidate division KSB1 bacterium]
MIYDAILLGLGAMGSAAAYHLARRGQRVLGLDLFTPPHNLGSSHGQTRIIREAYFEHPLYVPLVQKAYENWAELEHTTGQQLILSTGGAMIGHAEGVLVRGARASAATHHLPHEMLSAQALRRRFPAFHPSDEMIAVWEPRAGILFPEKCIAAHLASARALGATLRFEEPARSWRINGSGVEVTTAKNQYVASRLLIAAGAWFTQLVPDLHLPLVCARQALFWFKPKSNPSHFLPKHFPIFLWEYEPDHIFYGFPDLGEGIKLAIHHEGVLTDPVRIKREVDHQEASGLRTILHQFMPEAEGDLLNATVCMYTNTPDSHFLIDHHPRHPQVLLASPCSGHGFKFSSALGEILADLLTTGRTEFDLSPFRLARFTQTGASQSS